MKSVGETLKAKRLSLNLDLADIARTTKIKKEFLALIETNQFTQFPSLVTAKGFIKNYAEFLGFSSEDILAIFRRDNSPPQKGKNITQSLINPMGKLKIDWSPKLTLILAVTVFLVGLLGYLAFQYFHLVQNPHLEITTPKDKQQVFESRIMVIGKSDTDSIVKINDNLVALSAKGEFSYELVLFPGENKIMVEAVSKFGKKTTQERTIFRLDKNL